MSHLLDVAALVPHPVKQDPTWVLTTAFLVILSQLGLALVAAGSVRYKSVQSAIITIALGSAFTVILFYLFGYPFAFGDDYKNGFIGSTKFAGKSYEADEYRNDYNQFTFHAAAAIIVTGLFSFGTLERTRFFSYSVIVIFLSGFLYPVVAHWTFGKGWLHIFGYKDFAGSGVIHVFGGTVAAVATFFLAHRRDKADPHLITTFPHHSPSYIGLGSLVLVFSWVALISGFSAKGENNDFQQALVSVNALVAASAGGLSAFVFNYLRTEQTSLIALSRGAIAGLVAVSASADNIFTWAAALIGMLAAVVYLVVAIAIRKSKIDDPGQVIAQNLAAGALGVLLTGVFDRTGGLFYGAGMKLIGFQCVGLLSIIGWGLLIALFIVPLKGFGLLKVTEAVEAKGIDQSHCGGEAVIFHDEEPQPGLLSGSPKKQIFG